MQNQSQVQQFTSSEFGSIDILMLDGKPYFPATECAVVLGYKNPRKAIIDHCKGVTKRDSLSEGGVQQRNFIPEGDLYRLIIRSKLPAAERFERWVFDEVLPCIRKYGAYATADTLDELRSNPQFADILIRKLEREREKVAELEDITSELAPKALYCDLVLQTRSTIPITLIAKEYGFSAAAFNDLLNDLGIQYRAGGTWVLYQDYADRGYTKTHTYFFGDRTASMHTCWTQKGRMFLYGFLKSRGIVPIWEFEQAS